MEKLNHLADKTRALAPWSCNPGLVLHSMCMQLTTWMYSLSFHQIACGNSTALDIRYGSRAAVAHGARTSFRRPGCIFFGILRWYMGCFVCGHRSIFSARWEVLDDGIDWRCHLPVTGGAADCGSVGAGWNWKIWLFGMKVNGAFGVSAPVSFCRGYGVCHQYARSSDQRLEVHRFFLDLSLIWF